jgi:hypothetical protein
MHRRTARRSNDENPHLHRADGHALRRDGDDLIRRSAVMLILVFILIGIAFVITGTSLTYIDELRKWPGVFLGGVGGFIIAIAFVMQFSGFA